MNRPICQAKLEGGKQCTQPAVVIEDGERLCPKHSRHAKALRALKRGVTKGNS